MFLKIPSPLSVPPMQPERSLLPLPLLLLLLLSGGQDIQQQRQDDRKPQKLAKSEAAHLEEDIKNDHPICPHNCFDAVLKMMMIPSSNRIIVDSPHADTVDEKTNRGTTDRPPDRYGRKLKKIPIHLHGMSGMLRMDIEIILVFFTFVRISSTKQPVPLYIDSAALCTLVHVP